MSLSNRKDTERSDGVVHNLGEMRRDFRAKIKSLNITIQS